MIQTYKILPGIDRVDTSTFVTLAQYSGTRSHSMKLFKPQFESEC